MDLKVISAERTLFGGEVEMVKLPGTMGEFTVLKGHAPLVSTLEEGEVVYRAGGEERRVAVKGGVAEVRDDKVVVCVK